MCYFQTFRPKNEKSLFKVVNPPSWGHQRPLLLIHPRIKTKQPQLYLFSWLVEPHLRRAFMSPMTLQWLLRL